jgi:subtilisin family serine protease
VAGATNRYRADRVLVLPRREVRARRMNEVAAAHAALGATLHREYPRLGGWQVLRLPPGRSVEDALAQLRQSGLFAQVEPDYEVGLAAIPNDPSFGTQWGLHNTGQNGGTPDADIDAPEAWDIRTDAAWVTNGVTNFVIVGIVDTGIDTSHPDLVANLWVNPGEIPGNGLDDDGNGYVDDIHGINALVTSNALPTGTVSAGDPADDHYHGTHVAGTVGAVGDNDTGVAGVAWRVKLMALKFLDRTGRGSTSDAVECFNYAIGRGVHILNNSWGGSDFSQALADAVTAAEAAGIIVVAAAGNSGSDNDTAPFYPAALTNANVVTVLATDRNDKGSIFATGIFGGAASNFGENSTDLAAPGSSILSTFPTYLTPEMQSNNLAVSYGTLSGTSMAAPHVAGALALVKAHYPDEPATEQIRRIYSNADFLEDMLNASVTESRLNLHAALVNPPGPVVRFNTLPNQRPLFNTERFTAGSPPFTVTTTNLSQYAVSYQWDMGAGGPLQTTLNAANTYINPGTYAVTLTATSANGQSRSRTRTILVDYNYELDADAPYAWIEPAGHTALALGRDGFVSRALPFAFPFYGSNYTTLYIGANGNLGFITNRLELPADMRPPDPEPPNADLCVYTCDLDPSAGGGAVTFGVVGSAPRRIAVVTYDNIKSESFATRFTFQALLHEDTGDITFQYRDVALGDITVGAGRAVTIALEHHSGLLARAYSIVGSRLVRNGQAIRFTRRDVSLLSAQFVEVAGNANGFLDVGETVQEWVTLRNERNTPLTGLTATLASATPGVVLLTNVVPFPDLPPFATDSNVVPFRYQIAGASCGDDLTFELVLSAAGGASFTHQFTHRLGRQLQFTNTVDSAPLATSVPPYSWATNTLPVAISPGQVLESVELLLRADGYPRDLNYYLQHPDGAMVQLAASTLYLDYSMTNYGRGTCGAGAQRTVFSDTAATAINDPSSVPPYLGSYRPVEPLDLLRDKPVDGTWRLITHNDGFFEATNRCWGLRLVTKQAAYTCDTFDIPGVDDPPLAQGQNLTTPFRTPVSGTVFGVDPEGAPVTYAVQGTTGGAVTSFDSGSGAFTFTPDTHFSGSGGFTFTACDGALTSAVASVTINVGGANISIWTNAASGAWTTGVNWDTTVPNPNSSVYITNDLPVQYTVTCAGVANTLTRLRVTNPNATGSATLNLTNTWLELTGAADFNQSDGFSLHTRAAVRVNSGSTLRCNGLSLRGNAQLNIVGGDVLNTGGASQFNRLIETARLTVLGGSYTQQGTEGLYLGRNTGHDNRLTLSNGVVTLDGAPLYVARGGTGTVEVAAGLLLTINGAELRLADPFNASVFPVATFRQTGGVVSNTAALRVALPGSTTTGVVHQAGGLWVQNGPAIIGPTASGQGRFHLEGGTLIVSHLLVTNGARSVFTFDGGTLRSAATTVNNGAVFCVGNGLAAAACELNGGTHSFANGVSVAARATLAGAATVVGSVINDGTVAPGLALGRLNVTGSVSNSPAARTVLEVNNAAGTNDSLFVTGSLHYGGTLGITNVSGTPYTNGQVLKLFNAGGGYTGGFAAIEFPGVAVYDAANLLVDGTITVISALPASPPALTVAASDGHLMLAWPAAYLGWLLQAQTNSPGIGLGTNWVILSASAGTNQFTVPVDPANGSVFYRLVQP